MTSRDRVLERERQQGMTEALALQKRSAGMNGTELNAADDRIPRFTAAKEKMNMLDRKAGQTDGFVCKSTAGRVVRLIQSYDSEIYPQEPEELPAQWRFVWSTDPAKALPFIALSTSPYNKGDCCLYNEKVWRSGMDGNVWPPETVGVLWEEVVGD